MTFSAGPRHVRRDEAKAGLEFARTLFDFGI
jgi:hypothetical protein